MTIQKILVLFVSLLITAPAFSQENVSKKDKAKKEKEKAKKRKQMVKGYTKTPNGLYYKFHSQNKEGVKPKVDDFVTVDMKYRNEQDTLIFDSGNIGEKMEFPLVPSTFKGSFEEALMMMSKGDSAGFLIIADSLYIKTFGMQGLPPEIDPGSYLKFEVKLRDIRSKEDIEKEQMELFMQEMAKMEQRKFAEPGEIAEYIKQNNITVKPTESGLYFIEQAKGKGPTIAAGDTAYVHCTGTFLDGKDFFTTRGEEPLEVIVGIGMVIPGWDQALVMMSNGGKAKLIIPSDLAYGETGVGEGLVPPYTPLVFEVEVMSVKKKK